MILRTSSISSLTLLNFILRLSSAVVATVDCNWSNNIEYFIQAAHSLASLEKDSEKFSCVQLFIKSYLLNIETHLDQEIGSTSLRHSTNGYQHVFDELICNQRSQSNHVNPRVASILLGLDGPILSLDPLMVSEASISSQLTRYLINQMQINSLDDDRTIDIEAKRAFYENVICGVCLDKLHLALEGLVNAIDLLATLESRQRIRLDLDFFSGLIKDNGRLREAYAESLLCRYAKSGKVSACRDEDGSLMIKLESLDSLERLESLLHKWRH